MSACRRTVQVGPSDRRWRTVANDGVIETDRRVAAPAPTMIEGVSIADLARALERGRAVLLDTRAPGAFAAGHIPGSVAVALLDLPAHLRDPDVWLHRRLCDDPELIALVADDDQIVAAAVMLGEVGIRARLVRGGVRAWSRSGRPVNLGVGFGGSPSSSS